MLKSQKVLLITSGQPSLNPRLVKEADALADAGYNVTVLYAYWNKWGTEFDKQLIPAKKWKAICIGGNPQKKRGEYFLSKVIHRIAEIVNKITQGRFLADYAIARSSYFLIREAKKYDADLYIAHNLGALPAAVNVAKWYKKPCGFDAEDLHRYVINDSHSSFHFKIATCIEEKYIPQINYLSASSPQIAKAFYHLFPAKETIVLLNVFPKNRLINAKVSNQNQPIKLFWFSQNIGFSRGIEDIVTALQYLDKDYFELHLLGYHSKQIQESIASLNGSNAKIYYHSPVMPDQIAGFAFQFDIGLALEPGFSKNNDYALSNKIFTYMQAGLAIVASDTTAQKDLMSKYPEIGKVYKKGNAQILASVILHYYYQRDDLYEAKKASYDIALQELNWENESHKFLNMVKKNLNPVE